MLQLGKYGGQSAVLLFASTYTALTNDIETRRSHRRLKELTRCLLKRQVGTGPANPAGILAVATGHPGNRETSWADAVTVIASAA